MTGEKSFLEEEEEDEEEDDQDDNIVPCMDSELKGTKRDGWPDMKDLA
jgi:hypothetical protein